MSKTRPTPRGLYGRLGTKADLDARVNEARDAGLTVTIDKDAGFADCELEGETIFRAVEKGKGGAWIIMYNPSYYPKPEEGIPL